MLAGSCARLAGWLLACYLILKQSSVCSKRNALWAVLFCLLLQKFYTVCKPGGGKKKEEKTKSQVDNAAIETSWWVDKSQAVTKFDHTTPASPSHTLGPPSPQSPPHTSPPSLQPNVCPTHLASELRGERCVCAHASTRR